MWPSDYTNGLWEKRIAALKALDEREQAWERHVEMEIERIIEASKAGV